jgi:hypothetical protein
VTVIRLRLEGYVDEFLVRVSQVPNEGEVFTIDPPGPDENDPLYRRFRARKIEAATEASETKTNATPLEVFAPQKLRRERLWKVDADPVGG